MEGIVSHRLNIGHLKYLNLYIGNALQVLQVTIIGEVRQNGINFLVLEGNERLVLRIHDNDGNGVDIVLLETGVVP